MKIAIFTDSYFPHINGVSKTIKNFINYLKQNNHSYVLFLPKYFKQDTSTVTEIKFKSIKFIFYPDLRFSFTNQKKIKEVLDSFKPDIIQVMTEFPIGLAGIKYAKKNNIPLVSCFETNIPRYLQYYGFGFLNKISWKFYRWFHKNSDAILTPSKNTTDLLKKNKLNKIYTWERGIEFEKFNSSNRNQSIRDKYIPHDGLLFLFVGRLAIEKDIYIFIETAKILYQKYQKKIHFVVVGNGPILKKIKKQAPNFITFTGFITGDKLLELYASADIFLFPSPTETLGFVILEAMASQLPVIACFEGGVRDVLIDNYNGLACREKEITDYVTAATKLIENNDLRLQLGKNARLFAEKKDWTKTFSSLFELYNKIISKKNN